MKYVNKKLKEFRKLFIRNDGLLASKYEGDDIEKFIVQTIKETQDRCIEKIEEEVKEIKEMGCAHGMDNQAGFVIESLSLFINKLKKDK